MLKVIEGGMCQTRSFAQTDRDRIKAEGQRRKREAGVDHYLAREKLTGVAMPSALRAFMLQVEFAAQALSELSPVPMDVLDDRYWPTYIRATPFEAALVTR
jgi:hypothetical protein